MALVVESTSQASVDNSASVTVTKPTGVEVGDLLLILSHGSATCTGFSTAYSANSLIVLYRIADSTDVSASNYSISHGGSTLSGAAAMLRVSGWVAGNPVYGSDSAPTVSQDLSDPVVFSETFTSARPSDNSLMIILASISSDSVSGSFSSYTVTSGESNPAWTEIIDVQIDTNTSASQAIFAAAYALTTNNSDISAWGVTGVGGTGGAADFFRANFVVINAPQSAQGTNALLSVSPTLFAPTGSAGAIGTNALLEVSPTIPTQSGKGISQTQWTSATKNTTTWTKTNKS